MKKLTFALLALVLVGTAPQAQASFGCKVLLCLAASGGTPTECKPTLKKLFKRLAKGKSFPSCKFESGPQGAPQPERGRAVFVPQHMVCMEWATRRNGRGDYMGKYCPKQNQKLIKEHYDHSGKSCASWFPRQGSGMRDSEDPNSSLRNRCIRKSKNFVRIQGGGVDGQYFYY